MKTSDEEEYTNTNRNSSPTIGNTMLPAVPIDGDGQEYAVLEMSLVFKA